MNELLSNYKLLLEKRLDRHRLLNIGEDTIRYDFFAALMKTYGLEPHQIQLEAPINLQCFVPFRNLRANRKEKPLIDLVVIENNLGISAEFGLFRQNSNENGGINKTARTVKMLNDMIRVSLESHFANTKGYFICVADHKMLGHQMRNGLIDRFPSHYHINSALIERQMKEKTSDFDERFLNVYRPMNKGISSKLIYNQLLKAKQIQFETRLLIWETGFD